MIVIKILEKVKLYKKYFLYPLYIIINLSLLFSNYEISPETFNHPKQMNLVQKGTTVVVSRHTTIFLKANNKHLTTNSVN